LSFSKLVVLFSAVSLLLLLFVLGCACRTGSFEHRPDAEYDVIVIGAGMSGLSAAAHLGVAGLRVLVLEQHSKVGGCTSSFNRGKFRFDTALHEMNGGLPGSLVGDLMAAAGVDKKVELIRINSTGRTIAPGIDIRHGHNTQEMIAVLSERWPEEKAGITEFYDEMQRVTVQMRSLAEIYRASSIGRLGFVLKALFGSWDFVKMRHKTLQQVMDEYMTDPGLKTVVGQWWLYYGPPPSRLWAPLYMHATNSYLEDGAFQIKGGSHALAEAYAQRVQELGGAIELGVLVTSIDTVDGQVTGVTVEDGRSFTSRYVVSSADPLQTYNTLLSKAPEAEKQRQEIAQMEPNVSLVGVYLGLDVEPSFFGVQDYEVILSGSTDIDKVVKASLEQRYDEGVVVITLYGNLQDDWYAPEGGSVVTLNSYGRLADWPKDEVSYQAKKREMMDGLIERAESVLPGLRDHIIVQEGMTPYTIERYTLQSHGAPYGWAAIPEQWDRSSQRTPIDGLYLCGAWTAPSHGVAPAQMTGYRAARLILDQEGR
jgi:prolycopene isomerase